MPCSRRMPAKSSASIGRLRTGSAGAGVTSTELIRAAAAPSARSRPGSGPGGITLVPGMQAASTSPYPVRSARS